MSRIAVLAHSRIALALMAALAVAGCAKKNGGLPDNASGLGLDGAGGAGGLNGRGGNAAPGTSQDFTVNVGDRIFFDTDSSVVRADAQQILTAQARWLNQYSQYSITVEGHADERGTREYNLALGARRAAATREYLARQGVSGNRMRTISYGKERPVAVCDDISCWSQNRRAVTVLNGAGS
ncbi:MAG: peptidoglycan-associated lipoprotein Pal [Variovorax sp.]|nr:MAG: peptidoglycan-associated lipoprotein Pal [Variovorax sp.]